MNETMLARIMFAALFSLPVFLGIWLMWEDRQRRRKPKPLVFTGAKVKIGMTFPDGRTVEFKPLNGLIFEDEVTYTGSRK